MVLWFHFEAGVHVAAIAIVTLKRMNSMGGDSARVDPDYRLSAWE